MYIESRMYIHTENVVSRKKGVWRTTYVHRAVDARRIRPISYVLRPSSYVLRVLLYMDMLYIVLLINSVRCYMCTGYEVL